MHQLLRYLKASPGQELYSSSTSSSHLKAFSYADWGSCLDSHKSTTNFFVFLDDSLISWKAKRQDTISRSFAEAEYRALASTASELV